MANYETLNDDKLKKSDAIEEIFDWIESIIFSIFVISLIFTFILRPAIVKGPSMMPTLIDKDRLIISNIFYEPKDKDIIIINCKRLNEAIVKRVIATEGQEVNIDFEQGKVYVDGKEQFEPYINDITKNDFKLSNQAAFTYPITVPKNCVFVLGDNRNDSTDSRSILVGFVNKDDILGHAVFRVYPFNTFGTID